MNGFTKRLASLIKKEFCQLRRDNSSLLIGIVLPLVLIFLIGFGISLDVKNVPVAVVLEDTSPTAQDMLSFTNGSAYFQPRYVTSMHEAEQLMQQRSVDAIIRVPPDFTEQLYAQNAKVQVILYGADSTTANIVRSYIAAGITQWQQTTLPKHFPSAASMPTVSVTARTWFNDANSSTWYLIPGLLVLIITIVGVFLTGLVMAREWERGTLESMFVTPVQPLEILLAKMVPYFCIAMIGFAICLLAARFVFEVPLEGSLPMLIFSSMLYLLVALGIGLVISAVTKNQFLACQFTIVVSLLPTMMLTGFLFDLRSVPDWIRIVGYVLPATYYMEIAKTLFLAGNNWPLLIKNSLILGVYAVLFLGLALHVTRKRLE